MRLESAEHHRADPNRAQSRIRVTPIMATEQSAFPSLWQEAGYRWFHWPAHIQPLFSQ
jgi:hypothetical protein